MALDVYEMRAEDVADAAALWQSRGQSPAFDVVRQSPGGLVLVAREDGRLVAVAACIRDATRSYVMHVLVADNCDETMRRSIVGVTLRKLRARGIAKCHMASDAATGGDATGGGAQDQPFLASLRFNIPPTTSDAA